MQRRGGDNRGKKRKDVRRHGKGKTGKTIWRSDGSYKKLQDDKEFRVSEGRSKEGNDKEERGG